MSAPSTIAEGAEVLDAERPRGANGDGINQRAGVNESRTHPESLTPDQVSNSVVYIAHELFGVSKDAQLTELDVQCFVEDIARVVEGSVSLGEFVDSTQTREYMQSCIESQQDSMTDDSLSALEQASDSMMRDSRLQQASLQAVKLIGSYSRMNGRVYRHQIEDIVEGFSDIIANYIDPDYDGNREAVIDDLTQVYWLERLPYHVDEESGLAAAGAVSSRSLGGIALGGRALRPQQYM